MKVQITTPYIVLRKECALSELSPQISFKKPLSLNIFWENLTPPKLYIPPLHFSILNSLWWKLVAEVFPCFLLARSDRRADENGPPRTRRNPDRRTPSGQAKNASVPPNLLKISSNLHWILRYLCESPHIFAHLCSFFHQLLLRLPQLLTHFASFCLTLSSFRGISSHIQNLTPYTERS